MLKRMPHVQRAGDIGRRQHDAISGLTGMIGRRVRFEIPSRFPDGIPAIFNAFRVKAFLEFHGFFVVLNGAKDRHYSGWAMAADNKKIMYAVRLFA